MRQTIAALLWLLIFSIPGTAQVAAGSPLAPPELSAALAGRWVGVLEYRDYSEPAESTKRVELPTWLTISANADHWHYVYDDGPAKVVTEDDEVRFDAANSTYRSSANGKPGAVFRVKGYDTLRGGRGVLEMTGAGTDNGHAAEVHLVFTIKRNLLEMLEETRPAGSAEALHFRHRYRFVRSSPPGGDGSVTPVLR